MSDLPATIIKVKSVEPCGEQKVCITMELTVDVNRLAEVSGELMRTAVKQMKAGPAKKK
jgi:hypothetical protein